MADPPPIINEHSISIFEISEASIFRFQIYLDTNLGVVPDIGFLEALKVTNPVITEKTHQIQMKRHHENFKHRKMGMTHMPNSVAI